MSEEVRLEQAPDEKGPKVVFKTCRECKKLQNNMRLKTWHCLGMCRTSVSPDMKACTQFVPARRI